MKFFLNDTIRIFSMIFVMSMVGIVGLSLTAYATYDSVPDWIKNNARWWSEGSISETEYVKSLEYLITNRIIKIPIPITEVTAASTNLTEDERAQSFKVTLSNIVAPIGVHFFEKFEMTTTTRSAEDPFGKTYNFQNVKPTFFLESLPSVDKKQFYKFVADWMVRGDLLNEFNIDVDVLDGTGNTIQTWSFTKCEITSYGTYLQDITNFYQFSKVKDSEIRDRTNFSCVGVSLKSP